MTTVDVVVVAYRSARVIDACLAAARDIPGVGRIVVVDHGDDGSGARAKEAGALVIADASNPGFGAGQNAGLAATTAELVLLLNPDAQVDPAAIGRGARLIESRTDVALVQGGIVGQDGGFERSQGRALGPVHLWGRALHLRGLLRSARVRRAARRLPLLADHADRHPGDVAEVESLAATAILARRAALDDVGGFDAARYFLYGEDLDLCHRLRARGWRLLASPDVWASHLGGASSGSSWEREIEWWRGTMTYAQRWWGRPAYLTARGAAIVMWFRLAVRRPGGAGRAWSALVRRSPASAPARPSLATPSPGRP